MMEDKADVCLLALLGQLSAANYRFITPTPATHRRNLARAPGRRARDLRDIFGWSLPFEEGGVPDGVVALLRNCDMVEAKDGLLRSRLRVSSIGDRLFLHSAFPPIGTDAVFFGPDTYRFTRFLEAELKVVATARRVVDIGTGSGAGALVAGSFLPGAALTLTDTNKFALRLARVNARHAGVPVETVLSSGLEAAAGPFDLVIANPPFMAGSGDRTYRDGGDMRGAALSLAWAEAAARKLRPGGRMLLYTASAIVGGEDRLQAALDASLSKLGCALRYAELDPDIFGGQLGQAGYEEVERIAAVGAVIVKMGVIPPSAPEV